MAWYLGSGGRLAGFGPSKGGLREGPACQSGLLRGPARFASPPACHNSVRSWFEPLREAGTVHDVGACLVSRSRYSRVAVSMSCGCPNGSTPVAGETGERMLQSTHTPSFIRRPGSRRTRAGGGGRRGDRDARRARYRPRHRARRADAGVAVHAGEVGRFEWLRAAGLLQEPMQCDKGPARLSDRDGRTSRCIYRVIRTR
jgi:hypothetical protein